MSFRPHPLRQSQTIDIGTSIDRQPSNASSSASSGYSNQSDLSRQSQYTAASSDYMSSAPSSPQKNGHTRSQSSILSRAKTFETGEMQHLGNNSMQYPSSPSRQPFRPLPQAPANTSPLNKSSHSSLRHERGMSVDFDSALHAQNDGHSTPTSPTRTLPLRPNSMMLTRSDSIIRASGLNSNDSTPAHAHTAAHIAPPDLERLGRSSTTQLRTLSRLAQSESAHDFSISARSPEVVGLRGRRKLQRLADPTGGNGPQNGGYSWEGRNWMDKQRQFLQAYEYLCHIGEAKEWIEDVTKKNLPPIVELEEAFRNGVTLAEVVEALNPDRRFRIFHHPKLQFRHSDNIAIFFRYLDEVELPDLFRFELIDLYEKKNIPKVIYCIHALSWLLFRKGVVDFRIGNLVGQLEFEHHELEAMQKGLDKLGVNMPSFGNMGADFGVPEPEPEETEEERIERELAENRESVVDLQAQIRGALLRMKLGDQMQSFWDTEEWLIDLQSRVRGDFTRQIMNYRLEMRHFAISLQSTTRGFLFRKRLQNSDRILEASESIVVDLQSFIRAKRARTEVDKRRTQLHASGPAWIALQAAVRGSGIRVTTKASTLALERHMSDFRQVQSVIRAAAIRNDVKNILNSLRDLSGPITHLQSLCRGYLTRDQISRDRQILDRTEEALVLLQSHIRGQILRKWNSALHTNLKRHEARFIDFQAILRAMMTRAQIDDTLAELGEQEESIVAMQAISEGYIVRARFEEKKRFFNENMQKVVKIQSFVRARVQGEAYKSLTTGKNPPVSAVKNFVHLLNDSDFDFNEEVEFERMRKTVVQQVRQNEMVEQYIDQLDIKIALLVKNKITLDEVVRHQHNFGGNSIGLLANSTMTPGNSFDLKALNKTSRRKLESYQQLFFNLQTQPQYLARLFRQIRERGTAEKECRRIELLMMSLFGYAQKRREEYYLLKLIARSIREEVGTSKTVSDYLRGNFFWSKLLSNYTRSPRDRKFLRDLLSPLIRDNIIEDPDLDLESDPMQIYRSAINNAELRTGRPDPRPLDVPRDVAIHDPETRSLFIDHLRELRGICEEFFMALGDLLHKIPYGLRFLCSEMYMGLCQHFKGERQEALLQIVSHWLWKFYLQPALTNPENVGVIEKTLNPLQKRNLAEVGKVIGQIASGRPFGGENVFLQPLNAFVGESKERLNTIMRDVVAVADAEQTFDIDEFNDLYAKNKPTLYVKMSDVFAIHSLVATELPIMCPSRDDVLYEILQDLGNAKTNEDEMTSVGSSTEIQMFLTPKLHDVNDPEAEVKALFMETKRCVLYIIRVQAGANLLEILVKPITPEDESKWQSLLRDDFAEGNTCGAYSDANMIDVTRMPYQELKRTALENIMRLEQMGRISKHNYYQDVLNAIATDIRSKSKRRVQRQREVEGVRLTLSNLHEKSRYLEQQRKSYDDYIEQAMSTLQNKKGRKKFIMPFTKQYNHQRELERSGRVPKFGSFKYSVRSLVEKGVVMSWSGVPDRDWDKINLTISCDEVGVFTLEGSRGSIQMPGASALLSIEDLLQAQFEAQQFINLFEGNLKLNVNLLLHRLYKKFYRTQ